MEFPRVPVRDEVLLDSPAGLEQRNGKDVPQLEGLCRHFFLLVYFCSSCSMH